VQAPPAAVAPPVVTRPVAPAAFRVQVVAASTQAMADDALRRLRAMNLDGVVVREGGLFKVRAGAYATRAAAQAALPRIRAEFPGAFPVAGR
jgi:cell division septation protein DedD